MQLSLHDRKQQLIQQYLEEYSTKPQKWWKSGPDNKYKSSWEAYVENNYPRVFVDEISIKRNKEEAITVLLALSFFGAIFLIAAVATVEWFFLSLTVAIFGTAIYFSIKTLMDDNPRIVLNREGLWSRDWSITIPWAEIVLCCIRTDLQSESAPRYIRIHFYDPVEDNFKLVDCGADGLEKKPETIVCFIHQFLTDRGKQDTDNIRISFSPKGAV